MGETHEEGPEKTQGKNKSLAEGRRGTREMTKISRKNQQQSRQRFFLSTRDKNNTLAAAKSGGTSDHYGGRRDLSVLSRRQLSLATSPARACARVCV